MNFRNLFMFLLIWLFACHNSSKLSLIEPRVYFDNSSCISCSSNHVENLVSNGSFECSDSLIRLPSTQLYDFATVCFWNEDDSIVARKLNARVFNMPANIKGKIELRPETNAGVSTLYLGTPDYYRYNSSIPEFSFKPTDSISYAGISLMGFDHKASLQRGTEYLQLKLNSEMQADHRYQISFDYCLKEKFLLENSYASNALGFVMSDSVDFITEMDIGHRNRKGLDEIYYPLCTSDYVVSDLATYNTWKALIHTFVAKGGEKYITIGDVRKDSLIFQGMNEIDGISYYLIDNVRILPLK